MHAVVGFVAGTPDWIAHILAFAVHNPGVIGAAAATAGGIAISFYVTARSWRRKGC